MLGYYDNLRITKSLYNIGLGVQRDFNLKSLGSLTADFRCVGNNQTPKMMLASILSSLLILRATFNVGSHLPAK